MGDATRFDVEKLISYGDDLVKLLENDRDISTLKQCLQQSQALRSQCNADFNDLQLSMQEYRNKLDTSRRKTAETKLELVVDEEKESEVKEMEEACQREQLLREDLRVIATELNDLEQQSVSIEERMQALKKLEQEDLKREMRLSLYASVTSIIPNLDDESKISGHIVEREKKTVEKFEVDLPKQTSFDTCNSIWKMINL